MKVPKWEKEKWEIALDRVLKKTSDSVKIGLKKMFDYLFFYQGKGKTKLEVMWDKVLHMVEIACIYTLVIFLITK